MKIGDQARDFEVPDQEGRGVTLAQFRGRSVVLYFFPRANTPGCIVEARSFRDAYAQFERAGVVVLGSSPDTVAAEKKFKEKEKLPFPLLADHDRELARGYGVLKEKSMFGHKFLAVARTTFLIGPDGRIRNIFDRVKPEGHADEVLQELAKGNS